MGSLDQTVPSHPQIYALKSLHGDMKPMRCDEKDLLAMEFYLIIQAIRA